MTAFKKSLVVSHIVFRQAVPYDALEGPYSSVCNALTDLGIETEVCLLPISGFQRELLHGLWSQKIPSRIPVFLGIFLPLKYLVDAVIILSYTVFYCVKNPHREKLVVGIDPLSCLPLVFLKRIFGYRLAFYSVDFNKTRFVNKFLQYLYEKADELSSKYSDQTWVVCQSLADYKKAKYGVESIYIPNSSIFNEELFSEGKPYKQGNKMAWTGSFLTERQFDILFGLLRQFQEIRPDLEFYFAPMGKHEKFREFCQKYGLNKWEVLELHSRAEWQKFAAKCDLGIAIYDDQFGSTEFIEPLKIWDFLVCGMPFIISCEPSISKPLIDAGVVYFLGPGNTVNNRQTLSRFLEKENVESLQNKCVELAREFSIREQIKKALESLPA